jgi:uncharacterized damage-inducible protein DinB
MQRFVASEVIASDKFIGEAYQAKVRECLSMTAVEHLYQEEFDKAQEKRNKAKEEREKAKEELEQLKEESEEIIALLLKYGVSAEDLEAFKSKSKK